MSSREATLTEERLWPVFMRMRLAVALVLLLVQGMGMIWGQAGIVLPVVVCIFHVLACIGVRLHTADTRRSQAGWWLTVGMDVLAFALLQWAQKGNLNYALLFALPVLMSASLGARRLSLGIAAGVTLMLLLDAVRLNWNADMPLDQASPPLFQAAITGTAFFLVSLLAHQLALRLAREEAKSESSQRAARSQAHVNQLVIETLSMGVLVVDARGGVRTANPAARELLGDAHGPAPASFLLAALPHCRALADLVQQTFAQQLDQTAGQTKPPEPAADVTLAPTPDWRRRVRVRTRLTPAGTDDADPLPILCVLFLEDRLELEAQLRTEKLAAMGRMSVAVAHEIRNPLSAIAQANDLLREDLHDPLLIRLADMISTHTQRLNRIVDDVLNVVRVPSRPIAPGTVAPIVMDAAVQQVLDEWSHQHACTLRLASHLGCGLTQVVFDPEHLRRVLVNLLDNASRYATQKDRAIQISSTREGMQVRVSVWSDGMPIDATVHRHLFEPFFSSESRSSGLGLYLCRELCERYSASLNYQRSGRDAGEGNDFYLLIPVALSPSLP